MQSPVNFERHLAYIEKLQTRNIKAVDTVIVHCTELPDLETAWRYGERIMHANSGTGNSGHFYVDRDGQIEQWVPLERVAHHVKDHNINSVGIELVNLGRYPHWYHSEHQHMSEAYPEAQIKALKNLLEYLQFALPALRFIAGHEELDTAVIAASDKPDLLIRRKLDPGIQFPWSDLMKTITLERFSATNKQAD